MFDPRSLFALRVSSSAPREAADGWRRQGITWTLCLVLLALGAACGDGGSGDETTDTGAADVSADGAETSDSGAAPDAGIGEDAGATDDAGTNEDAATSDDASDDSGATPDAVGADTDEADSFFDPDVGEEDGGGETSGPLGLIGIDPARGTVAGETGVFLFGYGFSVDSEVLINGVPFNNVDVIDEETILARTPPNPAGTYDIKVVNSSGQATLPLGFTYFEALETEAIEPNEGPARGGMPVTVSGDGFTPNSQVSVAGRLGIDLRVISDRQIEFVLPPGVAGAADVRVTNENGTSVLQSGFLYFDEPEVLGFEPAAGPTGGDTFSNLVALGLTGNETVRVGPTETSAEQIDVDRLRVRIPAGAPGFADVTLVNERGAATLVNGYYYVADGDALSVDQIVPARGTPLGGSLVTVAGDGLLEATQVTFGGVDAPIQRAFENALVVETPPGSGAVDVEVVVGTESAALANGFTYDAPLEVSGVEPSSGAVRGGESVSVRGVGFTEDADVWFGPARSADVRVVSDTELQVTTPPGSVGPVDVRVEDEGRVSERTDAFTYLDATELSSVSPTRGALAGDTWVVIRGRGFYGDVSVYFGDQEATSVEVVDAATIEVRTPAVAEAQTVQIRVEIDGEEYIPRDRYVYFDPFSAAGGWWGEEIDGAVNVTVLDASNGERIVEAFVTTALRLDDRAGVTYSGVTNEAGQVTLSGPGLTGRQTISASAVGFSSATVTDVNAENVVVFLQPPPPDPSPGGGSGFAPEIQGVLTGLDKIVNPDAGQSIIGLIRTTTPGVGASNPPGTGVTQVTWTGGDDPIPYSMFSRDGELAVVALCGLFTEATGEFEPLYMGVRRGLAVRTELIDDDGDGEPDRARPYEGIDLDCNIDLDVTATFKLVNPPYGGGGITQTQVIEYLNFGNEGATDLQRFPIGRGDTIVEDHYAPLDAPELAGVTYEFTAQASGAGGGLPFSQVFVRGLTDLSERVIFEPFIPPALPEYPAEGGTLVDRRFEWSLATGDDADFYYAYITNVEQDTTYWEVWLPGDQTGFNLPFFPPGSGASALPEGPLVIIVLSIKSFTFDYDNWEFNDFGAANWRSFSGAGWIFNNPGN